MYHVEPCTSEPHHQHQNYLKCCIGHIKMLQIGYSPSLVPPAIYDYYVLCMLSTSKISLPTVVLVTFPLINIHMVNPQIIPLLLVFGSITPSTILILILFLPLLRKKGDGSILPLTLEILLPLYTYQSYQLHYLSFCCSFHTN